MAVDPPLPLVEPRESDVVADLVFLRREERHDTEKPYKLQYDPGEDLPRSNCINEPTAGITIHDIRGKESGFSLDCEGFTIQKLQSQLTPEDFYDDDKVKKVYYNELKDLLKSTLGARRVEILEHGVSNFLLVVCSIPILKPAHRFEKDILNSLFRLERTTTIYNRHRWCI
jgi:hypothetical protein